MNLARNPVALALFVAMAGVAGIARAQPPSAPAAPAAQPAPAATKSPIPTKASDDWIVYDETTYTPVVDDVSRHLNAARKAMDQKDDKTASAELRLVADELKLQAARAGKEGKALAKADKALLAADTEAAQEGVKRLEASALKVGSAAAAVESGKIKTKAELDRVIDRVARADMERRWLVTDVTTWYPVSDEPQRHFTQAISAYARKDFKVAATDIRKATGYLRLEAGRATGEAKQELDGSVAQLDTLATSVEKGAVKDEKSLTAVFAKADHALALEHRSKAAEAWARNEYAEAGYELKAAARGLESAAGWAGGEAKAGASATVADARALGDKLVVGATWTRDEVAKEFESLGASINALGREIGSTA
jgi:hypothetical protein